MVKRTGSGGAIIRTLADLRAMTADEVNEFWPDVQRILSTDGKYIEVDDDEAPTTLEDLRGKNSTYVNRFWPAIIKLLEQSAKASKVAA